MGSASSSSSPTSFFGGGEAAVATTMIYAREEWRRFTYGKDPTLAGCLAVTLAAIIYFESIAFASSSKHILARFVRIGTWKPLNMSAKTKARFRTSLEKPPQTSLVEEASSSEIVLGKGRKKWETRTLIPFLFPRTPAKEEKTKEEV